MLKSAKIAQKVLSKMDLNQRIAICRNFLDKVELHKDEIANDITSQMGKPIQQSFNEINLKDEFNMIDLAEVLKPEIIEQVTILSVKLFNNH